MLPLACTTSTKSFTKVIPQSYNLKTTTGISLFKNALLKNKQFYVCKSRQLTPSGFTKKQLVFFNYSIDAK